MKTQLYPPTAESPEGDTKTLVIIAGVVLAIGIIMYLKKRNDEKENQ